MNNEENKTTITPVVEGDVGAVVTSPVANEPVVQPNTNNGGNDNPVSNENNNDGGYVKYRVDRAKEQTTTNILKDLGVASIDEAKQRMADATKALEEVTKLKAKIEAQDYENEIRTKKQLLTKVLDDEKVFDTDALINYVDLDKVQIEDGQVKDVQNIVNSLKQAKPNFFGKFETVSDGYVKGQTAQPLTALDKQKNGNTVGAINDYLKTILK